MSKRCTKCGNFMMDDEKFCPNCGENAISVVPVPAPVPQQNAYQQPNGYPQQPYPAPAAQNNDYDVMTLGKWVGTIIVTTFFGLISIILLFVWGFGEGPEARKRYCKAMLIVTAISIGIGIIFSFVFLGFFSAIISEIANDADNYNWSSLEPALSAMITSFIH